MFQSKWLRTRQPSSMCPVCTHQLTQQADSITAAQRRHAVLLDCAIRVLYVPAEHGIGGKVVEGQYEPTANTKNEITQHTQAATSPAEQGVQAAFAGVSL